MNKKTTLIRELKQHEKWPQLCDSTCPRVYRLPPLTNGTLRLVVKPIKRWIESRKEACHIPDRINSEYLEYIINHAPARRHKDNRTNNPGRIVNNSAACRALIRATPHGPRPKARRGEQEHTHLPTCATHSTPTRRASLIIQRRGGGGGEGQGETRSSGALGRTHNNHD